MDIASSMNGRLQRYKTPSSLDTTYPGVYNGVHLNNRWGDYPMTRHNMDMNINPEQSTDYTNNIYTRLLYRNRMSTDRRDTLRQSITKQYQDRQDSNHTMSINNPMSSNCIFHPMSSNRIFHPLQGRVEPSKTTYIKNHPPNTTPLF